MLKVKQGDLEKTSLLYQRFSRRMFGFFFRLTQDGSTSEDLVQNVFMRLIKYKHTYAEDGRFESWIFQLARNVHHDHFKKNSRYQWQDDMESWESKLKEENSRESEMEREDELSVLKKAMLALSPEKRELIELTRFQKLRYEQVADLLGLSESAVKVRVHRTIKELRENYLKMDV